MAGMLDKPSEPQCTPVVMGLATFLSDARAQDVMVYDISQKTGYADYAVLATVSSFGQLRGLVKNVDDELMAHGIHPRGAKKNLDEDTTWVLLDCSDFIVHLMTSPARDFYALEKIWTDCPRVYPGEA